MEQLYVAQDFADTTRMSFPAQSQHWSSLSWTRGPAAPALRLPSITSADKPALVPWCPARTSPVKHPQCQHKWQHETARRFTLLWLLQVTATPHSTGGDIKQKSQQASIYRAGPWTIQSCWDHKSLHSHSQCSLLPNMCPCHNETDFFHQVPSRV